MTAPTIRAALERLTKAAESVAETDPIGALHIAAALADLDAARAALAAAPEGEGLEPTHEQISQWINANPVLRPGSTGGPMIRVGTNWRAAFADAARWGAQFRPATPPAPLEGEVGELVAWLERQAAKWEIIDREAGLTSSLVAENFSSSATLISQLSAAAPAVGEVAIPREQWHEDDGVCLWCHAHFTRIVCPVLSVQGGEDRP